MVEYMIQCFNIEKLTGLGPVAGETNWENYNIWKSMPIDGVSEIISAVLSSETTFFNRIKLLREYFGAMLY